jgi:hypothetical protein
MIDMSYCDDPLGFESKSADDRFQAHMYSVNGNQSRDGDQTQHADRLGIHFSAVDGAVCDMSVEMSCVSKRALMISTFCTSIRHLPSVSETTDEHLAALASRIDRLIIDVGNDFEFHGTATGTHAGVLNMVICCVETCSFGHL